MIYRLINGLYRRFVLPSYSKASVRREQEYEEKTVLQTVPYESYSVLTNEEKEQVRALFEGINEGAALTHFDELAMFKHFRGFDPRYVSHYIYLPVLAHKLNNYHYTKTLEHKSLLGYLVKGSLKFPHCYVRCIDGEYYDNEMLQLSREQVINSCIDKDAMVVKDSVDSAGGKSVELLCLSDLNEDGRRNEILRVLSERKNDFVIQEKLKQHESFSRYNPSSINTLRVTTLYLNGKYSTLSIVLRFGKEGMMMDNWGKGGVMIGVSESGKLGKVGYDIQLNQYTEYNGLKLGDQIIQQVPTLLEELEGAHKTQFPLCKFIGWDICFNEQNEPVVIELNSSQPGVIGEQLCTGPIFGDRTQEVLDYCSKKDFLYQRSLFEY